MAVYRRTSRSRFILLLLVLTAITLVTLDSRASGRGWTGSLRGKVHDAFAAKHIVYLIADWTRRDPAITSMLAAHRRSGVPLYLYYAPGTAEPTILPQILTEGEVLAALGP